MRVDENLHKNGAKVATTSPDANTRSTPAMLRDRGISALVVSTATNPVSGILSERDIVSAFAARGSSVLTESGDTSMTSPVVSCAPEELLTDATATMTTKRFRHMPVVEAGKLVGIVSIGDLVKHRLDELEQETSSLRAYIATA